MADMTATFFAQLGVRQTAAVKKSTADARATQAIATFTPSPPTPTIYPAGYRAPWADKMVKQADGTWIAPKEVVEEATKHYGEYYEWFASRDVAFVMSPDEVQLRQYSRFAAGGVLMRIISRLANGNPEYLIAKPKRFNARVIRVFGFSQDGLQALCELELQNIDLVFVERSTGRIVNSTRLADRIDTDVLTFDPSDQRWKWSGSKASVLLLGR
jgi:hypothetical protein